MIEHRCPLKIYDKDLCAQFQNWKDWVYLIILEINSKKYMVSVNPDGIFKVQHLGLKYQLRNHCPRHKLTTTPLYEMMHINAVWVTYDIHLYKLSHLTFNTSIRYHITIILDIPNNLIYVEDYAKVFPCNACRLT